MLDIDKAKQLAADLKAKEHDLLTEIFVLKNKIPANAVVTKIDTGKRVLSVVVDTAPEKRQLVPSKSWGYAKMKLHELSWLSVWTAVYRFLDDGQPRTEDEEKILRLRAVGEMEDIFTGKMGNVIPA